jgi:type IV pilus assembly protein PilX
MLKRQSTLARLRRTGQQGMVLLVALVVLVAIMIAGIAMMRSVDTATLVAGNLAFEQAATNAADKGIEQAIAMLQTKSASNTLDSNDPTNGYQATLQAQTTQATSDNPGPGVTWQAFWDQKLASWAYDAGTDQFGNHIFFVVHRECANAMPPGAGGQCVSSPAVTTATGNSQEAGEIELQAAKQIYYRITVRVSGPRRTESYVQSFVAM